MTFAYFAGRATLRRLHHRVHQNITRQHRLNVRHESTGGSKSSGAGSGSSSSSSSGSTANNIPPSRKASTVASESSASSASTTATTTSAGNGTGHASSFSGAYWAWLAPIRIPIRAYNNMQARSPLITQWETTLVIYFIGDLSAQTVQTDLYREAGYEPLRGLRALLIGGIISIPSYKWFLWLGRNFNYPSHLASLAVKVLVSQCLFTPLFNSYFFGMQSLLSGNSVADTLERIRTTVPVSWMNSWKLWPAVTAFSFTFVRPQNRSVFAGFVAIFWQTYLSWLNRNAELAEKHAKLGAGPA